MTAAAWAQAARVIRCNDFQSSKGNRLQEKVAPNSKSSTELPGANRSWLANGEGRLYYTSLDRTRQARADDHDFLALGFDALGLASGLVPLHSG